MGKTLRLITVCTALFVTVTGTQALAQEMSVPMSVPTARLFGRILSRQHGLEKETAIVLRTFVALFPENTLPADIFDGQPPALFYNRMPYGYISQGATAYALIEPPFGGYNFKEVPLGNYWFCKFDIDDDMTEEAILNTDGLMLSGCQYLTVKTARPVQQNYYKDEIGFWFDDFGSMPEDREKPIPQEPVIECAPEE